MIKVFKDIKFIFCLLALFSAFNLFAQDSKIRVAAERTDLYLPLLKGKTIAVVANHSSMIKTTHLVDSLLSLGIKIKRVFSPEHGFRGKADAGEKVGNVTDSKTGIPIISLYGSHKKPYPQDLEGVDLVVFDIQDVGVRYYTYISTMHYVMEAVAEANIQMLVLDRPNPNGFYVDGPVLKDQFKSFVGMHKVPLVHGMTVAEYAHMINSEGWLAKGIKCKLVYVLVDGYNHSYRYSLPIKPSPNLPNMQSVYLYPSLGIFEGTVISVGRGTEFPFQTIGHPDLENSDFAFTPISIIGASKEPPYKNRVCYGLDLRNVPSKNLCKFSLEWLLFAYKHYPHDKKLFFNSFFNNLVGDPIIKQYVIEGKSEDEIRMTWKKEVDAFKVIRNKYLLYPDFTE